VSYQRYGHRGSEEPAFVNSIDLTINSQLAMFTVTGSIVTALKD